MSQYKRIIILILALLCVIGLVLFFVYGKGGTPSTVVEQTPQDSGPVHSVIGRSLQGRSIDAYAYGTGPKHIALVGGIHGGYEWNTVVLAYQVMDYFEENPGAIPESLTVTIIPSANPDGVFKIVGKEGRIESADIPLGIDTAPGRFNGNEVDLNRNFDCKWQPESTWRSRRVSAGTAAFSEPEAVALRDFVLKYRPVASVFWHSQSGSVYATQCEKGILPSTLTLMNMYAKASGYSAVKTFDAYVTTGAADDWMASVGLPAVTVELTTHETIEFQKNLNGVKAMLEFYK